MAFWVMAHLAGMHHAALSVNDLDASIRWYGDLFEFEETFRQDSESRRVAVLRFPESRETLGLVQHTGGEGFDPSNLGLDHVAFSVTSGEELEAWGRRFDERGMTHSGPLETPFGGMLNFTDLDGIALALFWERS